MLSSIERLPANPAREDEPDRCGSCGEILNGEYCPRHCVTHIDLCSMMEEIDIEIEAKIYAMRNERDAAYRLGLWRQIKETHQEIRKLWKELCK